MRIERAETEECPMGKLIIYPDTADERQWLQEYAGFGVFNPGRRLGIYNLSWKGGGFYSLSVGWRDLRRASLRERVRLAIRIVRNA